MPKQSIQLIVVLSLALVCPPAGGQEYFGTFLDKLRGLFLVDAKPRPVFKLDAEFRFDDPNGLRWVTPAGTEVDGASIPQSFWSFIGGPFEGPYINASVIHDHYCRTRERTAHDTHRNFYYGMRASNVPEWKATFMYWAVSTFGPDWRLEQRIVQQRNCTIAPIGMTVCSSVPAIERVLVATPGVDLADPEVLAAAITKANAVARTLKTSDGKILDVTAAGQVAASPENIQASSAAYRKVFETKDYLSSPTKLGLLAQPSRAGLSDIQPWDANRIPRLSDAVVLTSQNLQSVEEQKPFKLDARSEGLIRERIDLKSLETSVQMQRVGQ